MSKPSESAPKPVSVPAPKPVVAAAASKPKPAAPKPSRIVEKVWSASSRYALGGVGVTRIIQKCKNFHIFLFSLNGSGIAVIFSNIELHIFLRRAHCLQETVKPVAAPSRISSAIVVSDSEDDAVMSLADRLSVREKVGKLRFSVPPWLFLLGKGLPLAARRVV